MSEHKEHEHLNSEALSVKLEGSAAARSWIIRGVVIFLVLVFFGGIALGANDLLTRDGTMPPEPELDETITDPPEGAAAICEYLRGSVSDALERKPRLRLETKFDFGNDKDHGKDRYKYVNTIEFAGADAAELERLTSELRYLAPSLCEYLHTAILARDADGGGSLLWNDERDGFIRPANPQDASPTRRTQYGESFTALLWSPQADPAALESAECTFVYYKCTACGKGESDPAKTAQCPECKAKGTEDKPIMVKSYYDNYTLTLRFPDGAPEAAELFRLSAPEEAVALLGDQLDGIAAVESIALGLRNARIEAEVNRSTKELKALRFKRDIDVAMALRLDPAFSPAGEVTLKFTMGENTNFGVTWPGAVLNSHQRTMNLGENSQLTVRYDAPWEQETPAQPGTNCRWESDNPALCAVDQEGYLKTGKNALSKAKRQYGTAVISVSFELDGQTYRDECVVEVKVPAENVKLSRRNLKLDAGETGQLTAKVTPNNATYKEADWYSENPEIASVDVNGLVTAVAPGEAVVYAVARDGYFVSKCFVTVKGGEG
ncbi:MAG: Ig-like domain-containing protein [Firmicutes bacterium]|nr:Ig-like domain-containing protein [Bacillota bacterium]